MKKTCKSILTKRKIRISEEKKMITIFNRKELLITLDMKRQGDVRDMLSANGINYKVKVTNRENSALIGSRIGRVGSLGRNQNLVYEYKIYVHKKDYDYALGLIR